MKLIRVNVSWQAALMSPEEFCEDRMSNGSYGLLASRITKKDARQMHKTYVEETIDAKKPVNAIAVKSYKVKLPENYVKRKEVYVCEN